MLTHLIILAKVCLLYFCLNKYCNALQSAVHETDIITFKELWHGRSYDKYTSILNTQQEQSASSFKAQEGHVELHLKGTRKDFLKDQEKFNKGKYWEKGVDGKGMMTEI